jgi:hypothetical protein
MNYPGEHMMLLMRNFVILHIVGYGTRTRCNSELRPTTRNWHSWWLAVWGFRTVGFLKIERVTEKDTSA